MLAKKGGWKGVPPCSMNYGRGDVSGEGGRGIARSSNPRGECARTLGRCAWIVAVRLWRWPSRPLPAVQQVVFFCTRLRPRTWRIWRRPFSFDMGRRWEDGGGRLAHIAMPPLTFPVFPLGWVGPWDDGLGPATRSRTPIRGACARCRQPSRTAGRRIEVCPRAVGKRLALPRRKGALHPCHGRGTRIKRHGAHRVWGGGVENAKCRQRGRHAWRPGGSG